MAKKVDFKNKNTQELNSLLLESKTKLTNLIFDLNDKKLKDTSQISKVKRNIARILTEINSQKSK